MANELRVRANFTGGLVDDNPLTSGATTLTSNALQALQVIGATQHMVIVFDPDGYGGNPEIAYLTGHTTAAGTATILRGQEGSTARAHLQDTPWVHSATAKDYDGSTGGTGLIGFTSYNPSASVIVSTTPPSVAFMDVDATNLKVDFTVPPSGAVLLRLTGYSKSSLNGARCLWNVRSGGANVAGSGVSLHNLTVYIRVTHAVKISGLTPGTATTWTWGLGSGDTGNTASINYGNQGAATPTDVTGAAVMEIWAVNL